MRREWASISRGRVARKSEGWKSSSHIYSVGPLMAKSFDHSPSPSTIEKDVHRLFDSLSLNHRFLSSLSLLFGEGVMCSGGGDLRGPPMPPPHHPALSTPRGVGAFFLFGGEI